MSNPNPYHPPANPDGKVNQRSLLATRGAVCMFAVIVVLYAASQSILGIFDLLTASPPSAESRNNPLLPPEFSETFDLVYRHAIIDGIVQLGAGIMLAVVAVFIWKYRRYFSHLDQEATDFKQLFCRFALYGFASAFVGVLASVVFGGAISYAFTLAITKFLAFLVFVGFGVSCLALILGWEFRFSIGKSVFPYALAVLGVGVSGYSLTLIILQFIQELSWRWQAFS